MSEDIHILLAEMSRPHKVVVFVLGMMEQLKAEGTVDGGKWEVTEKGDQLLAALRESGFQPTPEEIEWAVEGIVADSKIPHEDENEETQG